MWNCVMTRKQKEVQGGRPLGGKMRGEELMIFLI